MTNRPNFLFLISDQHRADHTGFDGNSIVRTGNLDALAARGVRFDRALVANPICMPNRSNIVTGRLPSVHGTRYNGIALDWGANTLMRSLRESGWHTAHIGKCHLQNMGMNRGIRDLVWRRAARSRLRALARGLGRVEERGTPQARARRASRATSRAARSS